MDSYEDFLFVITTIIVFLVMVCVSIVIFIIKSRNKIFKKELENKNLEIEFQNEILQKTIIAREEEQKRIAEDLHDDISSKLIAISLNLFLLSSKETKEKNKEGIINNIVEINKKTIEITRKIAHDLYPPVFEKFGLNAALEELFLDYNKTNAVKIDFNSNIEFKSKASNEQLQVFRIIQELINNSIKHGKASEIEINFRYQNRHNTCEYTDNGLGFNSKELERLKGLGYINIENRIKNIKGNYVLFSRPNQGCKIEFTFALI
jgi:signal transduction histidine kinase